LQTIHADAVIIGAGPAGSAAALGLARTGARVILCERAGVIGRKPGEIVEPTVRLSLAELGVLQSFEELNSLTLAGSFSMWDPGPPVDFSGIMNPYGHGALIDRGRFESWLISAAADAGVRVLRLRRSRVVRGAHGRWDVICAGQDDTTVVATPIMIEATGRGNSVLGHGKRDAPDKLIALLTYGALGPGPIDQRLLLEASEDGWWYAAPIPGGKAVIAFMTDPDLIPSSSLGRAAYIRQKLETTTLIRGLAAKMQSTSRLVGFPANGSIKQTIHGTNWVSIGDAAATYDPLSGRGVALALAKGVAIARLVSQSCDAAEAFRRYADAERATFSDYTREHRETYRRAATRHRSAFWARRTSVPPTS